MLTAREVRLRQIPKGMPSRDDFAIVDIALPELKSGEVLIEALLLSVDPFMRLRMSEQEFVGKNFGGSSIGRVKQSRNPDFAEGSMVRSVAGFRDYYISDGSGLMVVQFEPDIPMEQQISALGGIGMCAYGGLFGTAKLRDGEQVFVSAAAGAVGSLAGQIAKIKDCYVVGSTGSEEKAELLRQLCVDAVINYKQQDIVDALAAATPNGIDVYFENVGGRHLDAALARMNIGGRIPVCGMISAYNDEGSAVNQLHLIVAKRVLVKGFQLNEFPDLNEPFRADMLGWLRAGAIRTFETVFDGIDSVPDALIGILNGSSVGKTMVRVAA